MDRIPFFGIFVCYVAVGRVSVEGVKYDKAICEEAYDEHLFKCLQVMGWDGKNWHLAKNPITCSLLGPFCKSKAKDWLPSSIISQGLLWGSCFSKTSIHKIRVWANFVSKRKAILGTPLYILIAWRRLDRKYFSVQNGLS